MGRNCTPGRELSVRRSSCTQKSPFVVGQKGTFTGSKEKAATGLWKPRQSKNCRHGPCYSPVAWPKSCIFWCNQGQGAGEWGLKSGPKEGTAAGCEEKAWRDWSKERHSQESFGRNAGRYRSRVPLMSGTRTTLSPRHWTTRKSPAQGNLNQCELPQRPPSPSSIQLPVGSSAEHSMPNYQQDRNTAPWISRQVT